LSEAPTVLAQVNPQTMTPLPGGDRYHVVPSTDGGVQQRGVRIAAEHRQAQAQRPVGKPRLTDSTAEVQGVTKLCRTPVAGEAEARQALSTCVPGVQATFLSTVRGRSTLG
jgi:hypothetical protein